MIQLSWGCVWFFSAMIERWKYFYYLWIYLCTRKKNTTKLNTEISYFSEVLKYIAIFSNTYFYSLCTFTKRYMERKKKLKKNKNATNMPFVRIRCFCFWKISFHLIFPSFSDSNSFWLYFLRFSFSLAFNNSAPYAVWSL